MPKVPTRKDTVAMSSTMLAEPPTVAKHARRPASEVNINLRASKDDRDLIDRAAALRHTTRTDFMLASATGAAIDALLDQSFFTLDADQWKAFTAALDAPVDNTRLKRLMARKAPWET